MRVKAAAGKVLKEILGRVMVALGLHHRQLNGISIVVAFHSVTKDVSDSALRCSERDFDRYCAFFAKHLRVETFSTLVDRLRNGTSATSALSITFDDGYADNEEIAAPLLARWKLPALFFVTTDFIGSRTQTFWDKEAGVESRWMTWEQLRALASAGHEIGSHTKSHADLAQCAPETVVSELAESRDAIAQRVSAAPRHFAIPFGRAFDSMPFVSSTAVDLGYESVCLCRGGLVDEAADALRIERWPIDARQYLSPFGWIVDVVREARSITRTSSTHRPPAARGTGA